MAKKVLVITYYWPPGGGAGVQRILKFVKYFPQFGIEPHVLTVNKDSAFYPVIDETLQKEISPDLKIAYTDSFEPLKFLSTFIGKQNVPQSGFSNKSHKGFFQTVLRFIRGNFFIPDARVGWVKYANAKAIDLIEKEKIDTILISSPPHSSQLIGLRLKKKYPGIKWIADLRDPWTDIYYYREMLHSAPAKRIDMKMERQVLEQADAVISVSTEIRSNFIKKSSVVDGKKFHIIPNGFDADDFSVSQPAPVNEFRITYTGTIAASYNPDVFFKALENLVIGNPDVKFKMRFVGSVYDKLADRIKTSGLLSLTEFIPPVSHEDAIRLMLSSTILLLVIPQAENEKGILTGKLFEYLAARKPIINIGPVDGEAAKIISECAAGKTFDRNNTLVVEQHLLELVERWKQNSNLDITGNEIIKYSRSEQAKKLSEIIHDVSA